MAVYIHKAHLGTLFHDIAHVIGGYYRQVGVVWDGGSTLARLIP